MASLKIAAAVVLASLSVGAPVPQWMERAVALGIESAHLEIEYSLTDNCDLGVTRVIENSNPDVFDSQAVSDIIETVIGPFTSTNTAILSLEFDSDTTGKTLSMTKRTFSWDTDLGHRYIVCNFLASGAFESAIYSDGHLPPSKKSEDRPVARRLSELGTRVWKIEFDLEG